MENITKLIDALSKLIGAIVWPVLVIAIFVYFRSEMSTFISNMSELSFKVLGADFQLKRLPPEAVAKIAAADIARLDKKPEDANIPPQSPSNISASIQRSIESVETAATSQALRQAKISNILWIDDNPTNNAYEQQALEAFGMKVTLAKTSSEALEKIRSIKFDAIISDMGRPEGKSAGFDLLSKIRENRILTPYIIYSSIGTHAFDIEARGKSAFGATNMPGTLIKLVLEAIQPR